MSVVPETQTDTWLSIQPVLPEMEKTVFEALRDRRARDDERLAEVTGYSIRTAGACRNALVRRGLVRDSGQRILSPHGREVIAWEVGPPTDREAFERDLRRRALTAKVRKGLLGGDEAKAQRIEDALKGVV